MSENPETDMAELDSPFETPGGEAREQALEAEPTGTSMMDRLMNTEPNHPVEQMGDLSNIRDHWTGYLIRGVEKVAGANDAWAAVDLLKGTVGFMLVFTEGDGEIDGEPGHGQDMDMSPDAVDNSETGL